MKIKIRATQELPVNDTRRLMHSLATDPENFPLDSFTVCHPHNVAMLKMAPISNKETLIVQHVLQGATLHLFAMSVDEDHRGWCFLLPQHGNLFATNSSVVYTSPDLSRLKKSLVRRVRTIAEDIKALDPEIYLPHSDFSVCGIDNGAILFVARNTTNVITQ